MKEIFIQKEIRVLSPQEKEIIKSLPAELEEKTVEELKSLARVMGGDLGMSVRLGEAGKGSCFDPRNGEIVFDPLQLLENPSMAKMVAAHEGSHRRFTRSPKKIGVKSEAIEELYGDVTGFSYLSNAIEDPLVNNGALRELPTVKPDFDQTYDEMLAKENIPLGLNHPEIQEFLKRTGTIPNILWVGSEIIRYWHQHRFSHDLEKIRPAVAGVMDKIIDPASRAYETLPENSHSESEITAKARERFQIIYDEIWPELEPLAELDRENEVLRRMIKETGAPVDNLPKEIREELAKAVEKGLQNRKDKDKDNNESAQGAQEPDADGLPLEMNDLSEEAKKQLKKQFQDLPAEKQNELREEAKRQLQDLEDALNRAMRPKLDPDDCPTHQELREQAEEAEKKQKEEVNAAKEFEKNLDAAKKIMEKNRTAYDKVRHELDPVIDDLYERLEEFFIRERQPKWRKGFSSGSNLTLFKAMQFASGAKTDAYQEMWQRKDKPNRFDYKFSLLIDLSQSMSGGNKIKETVRGLIVLTEVLDRLGIAFNIHVFNGEIGVVALKDFDVDFDDDIKENIVDLDSQVNGNTPTSSAIKKAYEEIKNEPGKDNFVITLTDGQPYPEGLRPTQELVKKILQDEEIKVKLVGLGLGKGTSFVKELFPSAMGEVSANDLAKVLGELLEEMIVNPEVFELSEYGRSDFLDKLET